MPGGGKQPGAGRPKGSLSKRTIAVKEAIEQCFDGLGGVPSLVKWAKSNPDTFYGSVWPKILPRDFNIHGEIKLSLTDERRRKIAERLKP
jgi:hypothetical protein